MSVTSHTGHGVPLAGARFAAFASGISPFILALAVGLSGLLAYVMVITDGNIMVGGVFIGLVAVVAITVYRVDLGFTIFIFLVLFFDQYDIPGFPTFTTEVGFFLNLNAIPWMPKIDQGVITPMEIQLFLIFGVWFMTALFRGSFDLSAVPLKGPMTLLYLAIIGALVYGLARGGDAIISLWETRALFYMGMMILFVPQVIKTENELRVLIWGVIAGVSAKAFQGAYRFASFGFSFGRWPNILETFTNHEDPVFMVTLVIFLLALLLLGEKGPQRQALLWLLVPMVLGYVAAQRRAAYASFMASLTAFIVLIPAKQRKTILIALGVFAVFFSMYLAVFWNSYSRLGSIAQQFKATVTDEGGVRGEKDLKSTAYRKIENYNLAQTFIGSPAIGIGFGRKYEKVMTLWGSGFALGDYVAHNQILWIFVQMGTVGAFCFWLFFNSYVFRGAMVFAAMTDPYLKALCAMCVIAVVNQLVVSFVDMQLTYYRNMVYLGMMMGLVPVLQRLDISRRNAAGDAAMAQASTVASPVGEAA